MLVVDENGRPQFCDGIVEDITKQTRGEHEREALIAQLQTSLFYLREPVTRAVSPAISLDMGETVRRAAALMTKNRTGAVFVTGPDGDVMGIVTDNDFRERVRRQQPRLQHLAQDHHDGPGRFGLCRGARL